jgi:hypothetical protein
LGLLVSLIVWLVRVYVKHVLLLAGINPDQKAKANSTIILRGPTKKQPLPVAAGIVDLKSKLLTATDWKLRFKQVYDYLYERKTVIGAVAGVIMVLFIIYVAVKDANTDQRGYEITYSDNTATKLNSEEIIYNQLRSESKSTKLEINSDLPKVKIVNRSGVPGMGAKTRFELEMAGYEVVSLGVDLETTAPRTIVLYQPDSSEAALNLSAKLNKSLLSTYEAGSTEESLTILLGSDI